MQTSSKTSKAKSQADSPPSRADAATPGEISDTLLEASVFAGLLGFGVFYDRLVSRLERTYGQHGYTSFLVVLGVSVTVAAVTPFIGPANALRLVAAFAAAGVPMIVGDSKRYLQYRHDVSAALERARSMRNEAAYARQAPAREGQGPALHSPRY
jgi:hypothetical protein